MLYIDPNSVKIKKAERVFLLEMRSFVVERIHKALLKTKAGKKTKNSSKKYLCDNIDKILIGNPHEIADINDRIDPFIKTDTKLGKIVKYAFNYDSFTVKSPSRFDAYKLAELLDINTCPYCNRNYTNVVKTKLGKKITRPQFDHYFDKKSHPGSVN